MEGRVWAEIRNKVQSVYTKLFLSSLLPAIMKKIQLKMKVFIFSSPEPKAHR